jgi:hypothetical protein
MIESEFTRFIELYPNVEVSMDDEGEKALFRVPELPYFAEEGTWLGISKERFSKIETAEELYEMIAGDKDVTQITRITGYFSAIASWNPGKRGELKARKRESEIPRFKPKREL